MVESSNTNLKRKRRVVPDSERKRAAISCDRCRKRKLKCQMAVLTGNQMSALSSNNHCTQCLKAGTPCTRELPRKQRVYGSTESLSVNYQALIYIFSKLFPGFDYNKLDSLKQVAEQNGITLPEFHPQDTDPSEYLGSVTVSSTDARQQENKNKNKDKLVTNGPDPIPKIEEIETISRNNDVSLSIYNPYQSPRFGISSISDIPASPSGSSSISFGVVCPSPDFGSERIIYDRAGLPHYAGSIGSMAFFDGLCKLINRTKNSKDNNIISSQMISNSSSKDFQSNPILSLNVIPSQNQSNDLNKYYGPPRDLATKHQLGIYFYTLSASSFSAASSPSNSTDQYQNSTSVNTPDGSTSNSNSSSYASWPNSPPEMLYQTPKFQNQLASDINHLNNFSNEPRLYELDNGAASSNHSRDTVNQGSSIWDLGPQEELPTKAEADKLVAAFFEKVHPIHTLFNVKQFMAKYENYWEEITKHSCPKRNPCDALIPLDVRCCLYMVFVMGSRALSVDEKSSSYYSRFAKYSTSVERSLFLMIATPSLHTVQALFLLALYLYGINERNVAWLITGIGCRSAIAMGLHRESASSAYSYSESQVRKQVWWTLYSLELHLSANLGRPRTMRDEEIDISIPVDPELHIDEYYPPGGLKASIKALQILNMTMQQTQSSNISHRHLLKHSNMEKSIALCRQLKDMLGQLPKHLREFKPDETKYHIRAILNIHMQFHYSISIISRPYILYLIGSDPTTLPIQQRADLILLLNIGCAATSAMAAILNTLHKNGLVTGIYHYDIYFGYCATMVLALGSLIISSGKFSKEELAYDVESLYESIRTIIHVMDSSYLEGTMYRLAQVTAYILRDLGIDSQLKKHSGNKTKASKDEKLKGVSSKQKIREPQVVNNTQPGDSKNQPPLDRPDDGGGKQTVSRNIGRNDYKLASEDIFEHATLFRYKKHKILNQDTVLTEPGHSAAASSTSQSPILSTTPQDHVSDIPIVSGINSALNPSLSSPENIANGGPQQVQSQPSQLSANTIPQQQSSDSIDNKTQFIQPDSSSSFTPDNIMHTNSLETIISDSSTEMFDLHPFFTADDYDRMFMPHDTLKATTNDNSKLSPPTIIPDTMSQLSQQQQQQLNTTINSLPYHFKSTIDNIPELASSSSPSLNSLFSIENYDGMFSPNEPLRVMNIWQQNCKNNNNYKHSGSQS